MSNVIVRDKGKWEREIIENQLRLYYVYQEEIPKLKAKKKYFEKMYEEEKSDPHVGGSVAVIPEGNNSNENIVTKWLGKIADINALIRYRELQVNKMNNWLYVLTQSQRDVIMKYVCEYQCDGRRYAANDLNCSDETVKSQKREALDRIRENFDDFT